MQKYLTALKTEAQAFKAFADELPRTLHNIPETAERYSELTLYEIGIMAATIIPATSAWIVTERVWIAALVAVAFYLATVHGVPSLMRIQKEDLRRAFTLISTRVRSNK